MQVKIEIVSGEAKVELVNASPLFGTERQIAAADGIRVRMIQAIANAMLPRVKTAEALESGFGKIAPAFDAMTSKQWLDANDEWDGSKQSAMNALLPFVR